MKNNNFLNTDRRNFLTKVIPACALTCLGSSRLFAMIQSDSNQKATHKFDNEMERKLTNRQFMRTRYRDVITIARALEKELGKQKTIEFLKKTRADIMLNHGKSQAKKANENTLNNYVEQFRSGYENSLTMKIVEDTEKSFKLHVTECLWADAFLHADAGAIGYAWVCWGDYAWAQGFNPNIEMIRDKTLMQGHGCCNHHYVWKG